MPYGRLITFLPCLLVEISSAAEAPVSTLSAFIATGTKPSRNQNDLYQSKYF